MRSALRVLAYGLLMAATPAMCRGAVFNGVTYAESGNIVRGQWNGQFSKAKSYAASAGVPLVVVWVNPPCGYCKNFEQSVMASDAVKAWMKTRQYVFVFAIKGVTADADAAFSFVGGGNYPRARVAVPGGASSSFTARMTAKEFMNKVDGVTGASGSGSGSGSTPVTEKAYALRLTASPSAGGVLSGAGSYEAGKTVTVRARANANYVFSGWYVGSTLKSQATVYAYKTGSATATLTGKFVLKSADKVTALTCPLKGAYEKGKQIAEVAVGVTATSLPTVRVAGLPSGLSYSSSSGKISGKPSRSGVYAPVVTAKTAGGAQMSVTNEVVVRASGEHVLRVAGDAAAGTTSGTGVYAAGRRVTLRATPARNYVFLGWHDGAERLSEAKSYAYVMPSADKTLTAKFATSAADAAAVTAAVNGLAFGSKTVTRMTNLVCGVAVSWPVSAAGLTTTTASVSGLPAGLSYSSKTGLITGVPSRAQTKEVKIVAKTASGTKVTYGLSVTVRALPTWAVGTFNGGADGLLTLTVGSTGRISGKYAAQGTNWTLTAKSYAAYDARSGTFSAEVVATSGKAAVTHRVVVSGDPDRLLGKVACAGFTGWWNGWKDVALRDLAKRIDRAANVTCRVDAPAPGTITLSFGASGALTAKGVFTVGYNARTKRDVTYAASCSTALCRTDGGDELVVYIYFPPKKGTFDGLAARLVLDFDGTNMSVL